MPEASEENIARQQRAMGDSAMNGYNTEPTGQDEHCYELFPLVRILFEVLLEDWQLNAAFITASVLW